MYNNVYQEYINSIIGTVPRNYNNFQETEHNNWMPRPYFQNGNDASNLNLERFYPELYKLIYPMIQTACIKNTKPLTQEVIDEMVKDIYSNFVSEDATILNINLTNDLKTASKVSTDINNKNSVKTLPTNKVISKDIKNSENTEAKSFRPNNYVLSDLIRILLIRELTVRPANNTLTGLPFRKNEMNFAMQDYSLYENNFDEGYNIF